MNGNTRQLIVNNKPFLMLGGELGNSSASSRAFMQPVWGKLQAMHINTVLMPVYWELIEPEENKFDFTLIDSLVSDAANNNIHLVLLWFGTWKNSMSVYVPEWVKKDTKRFKRTISKESRSMEIISALSKEALDADCKAFATLMKHIKATDGGRQTVIMVQVENEVGMLSTAKETQQDALQLFNRQVPAALMQYLQHHQNNIVPELKERWSKGSYKTKGTWKEVFGNGLATDEIFQAYLYASYVDKVAAAGKQEYNIPMYVNAALNRPGVLPGDYPSAGPLPQVMDIWKMAAPHIDFLSPDFYNPDTKYWCDLYTRRNNTLFIPEIRFDSSDAAKAFFTIGHYHSLGFSPFAVERGSEEAVQNLQKSYSVLQQLTPFIMQSTPSQMDGVLLDKQNETDTLSFGNYIFKISHDNTIGWNGHKGDSLWDATGAIIIQTAPDEFIVGGTGIIINFYYTDTAYNTGILAIENGTFNNGNWQPNLRLNGDEDHQGRHLRIPLNEWDIQKVKLYRYK
ncbi:mannonate dehydratase [Ilyomonas limi]|uniref:Mannonate dehydratase n=2 Tax=Ilyomonas limi TaxID=2575867 RepID=A0A4U3KVW5_9BACT|nr:mannonate dehydratase [Ilyomonas limi]